MKIQFQDCYDNPRGNGRSFVIPRNHSGPRDSVTLLSLDIQGWCNVVYNSVHGWLFRMKLNRFMIMYVCMCWYGVTTEYICTVSTVSTEYVCTRSKWQVLRPAGFPLVWTWCVSYSAKPRSMGFQVVSSPLDIVQLDLSSYLEMAPKTQWSGPMVIISTQWGQPAHRSPIRTLEFISIFSLGNCLGIISNYLQLYPIHRKKN